MDDAAADLPPDGGLSLARTRGLAVGEVASRLVGETDACRVWQLEIAPGAATPVHLHRHPHVLTAVTGGEIETETIGGATTRTRLAPGQTVVVETRRPAQRLINRAADTFRATLVELRTTRWVFAGDLPPAEPGAAGAGDGRADAYREILTSTGDLPWSPKSLPGLSQKMLWRDEASGASIALIRFEKGAGIPSAHLHASNQFMFCLAGQYRYIPTGTTLVPGTFYCNPKGSVHGPTIADETAVFLEIYDGPHYPVQPPWYSHAEDAR